MKYHWIGFTQSGKDKKQELIIPHQSKVLDTETSIDMLAQNQGNDENFQPQIIQTTRTRTLVNNMTKAQVKESCSELLKRTIMDSDILVLAIGNCVLSNYRAPVIEIRIEEGVVKSAQSRQAQIRRKNIRKSCQQRILSENPANAVEKQLLLGICVSGTAK